MQDITLDFTGCKYFLELHDVLKKAFGFPDYYGKNLDALWDCLDNYFYWDLCVYVKDLNTLPKEFEEYMQKMIRIFERVHSTTPNILFEIIS